MFEKFLGKYEKKKQQIIGFVASFLY